MVSPLKHSQVREQVSSDSVGKDAADTLRQMADQLERNPGALVHFDLHIDPRAAEPRLKSLKVIVHMGGVDG